MALLFAVVLLFALGGHKGPPPTLVLRNRTVFAALILVPALFLQPSGSLCSQNGASPRAGSRPAVQPIPFSHKLHVKFITTCNFCHVVSKSGMDMSIPNASKCMQCHSSVDTENPAIIKLAQYQKQRRAISWVPVYTVPDYVLFPHQAHIQAKIACQECHGPVKERDTTIKEKPTTMKFCVDCHTRSHAPVACDTCHAPNP